MIRARTSVDKVYCGINEYLQIPKDIEIHKNTNGAKEADYGI